MKKRIGALIVAVVLIFSAFIGLTACDKGDGVSQNLLFGLNNDEKGYTLVGLGRCNDTEIIVPETYRNLPVTQVARGAFLPKKVDAKENLITKIVLPKTIERVGNNAFSYCTSLKEVVFSSSVTELGESVFSSCTNLESVTLPSNLTVIKDSTFHGCKKLKDIVIPTTVTKIEYRAFRECESLETVNFSNALKTIGHEAFFGCSSLTSVNLPTSLIELGGYSFAYTKVKTFTVPKNIKTVNSALLGWCEELETLNLPADLISIEMSALAYCINLTTINFAGTLQQWNDLSIAENVFDETPKMIIYCVDGEIYN